MGKDPKFLTLEAYFTVALSPVNTEETTPKIIFVRLVSFTEDEPPRVQTDPFIDIYDDAPGTFAQNKDAEPTTFRTVVDLSLIHISEPTRPY